jgi:hypothetical protein
MDAFVRLRWSLRRAAVKSRGSEQREDTRVRSTASPFARQVEGEPRGARQVNASPGNRPPRRPTRVPASDSEQASRASCRSLVESGRPVKRELDSQPGNRCFAARWPSMVGASAQPAGVRGNGPPPGVLDLHVGCRSRRAAFGSPDAARRQKALRVVKCRHRSCGPAGSDSLGSVRGKPVRTRSRDNTPPPRANLGDPKRLKRHERDTRRASAKTRSSADHVKLGCSFFEKWVVRLKTAASRDEGAP